MTTLGERSRVELIAQRVRSAVMPLSRHLRHQIAGGLSASQQAVIGTLHRRGDLTLGELAHFEQVSPSMITKVITVLEGAALVERSIDPADRRVCTVRLTAAGERWVTHAQRDANALLVARLEDLTEAELTVLEGALPLLERLVDENA